MSDSIFIAGPFDPFPFPNRIIVDGRPATVVGAWHEPARAEEPRRCGYDYRFDGEASVHWIAGNSPRLGGIPQ